MNPWNEERRKLYWFEYFVSLRQHDERRAREFRKLAQAEEKKKRLAKKWHAEQFQLL